MAPESAATLVSALRQFRLLQHEQMEQCTRELEPRFADPRTLARELVQRGWLTPYQVNELFLGRGQYLLLGSYVLLDKLGEGGMGTVFKSRNWKLDTIAALKVIKKDRLIKPDVIRRFHREIRAAAQLNHPHIVRAFDADEVQGTHFFVMEFVEGADLHQLVKTRGPMPVDQACDCIRQAALGLQHAFERGLVHRDIKPHNLLLCGSPSIVKILDMGLALTDVPEDNDSHSGTMTQTGVVMGTPDYMAPEQSRDAHRVDIRADLYSLGCTLYFLLSGRVPFAGGSLTEKLLKHQMDEPDSVRKYRPDVSEEVESLVRKLLAKRPEDRYQTPIELVQALELAQRTLAERPASSAGSQTAAAPPALTTSGGSNTEVVARQEWARIAPDTAPPVPQRTALSRWLVPLLAGLVGSSLLVGGMWWAFKPAPEKKLPEPGPSADRPVIGPKTGDKGKIAEEKKDILAVPGPVTEEWIKAVQVLEAKEQARAVFAKLKELNPGFDDQVISNVWEGQGRTVTKLAFQQPITDVSPVRALKDLQHLGCSSTYAMPAQPVSLNDLRPLRGLRLRILDLSGNRVSDLSPLADMPLESLNIRFTYVDDLTPLKNMQLRTLTAYHTLVRDLTPLQGMKSLNTLEIGFTRVEDLTPLTGLPLTHLYMESTAVRDLTPLRKSKLSVLNCSQTSVEDLSPMGSLPLRTLMFLGTKMKSLEPLKTMPYLKELSLNYRFQQDDAVLKTLKLARINGEEADRFWRIVEPGPDHAAFVNSVRTLSAPELIQQVTERLGKLNPDAKLEINHKEEKGAITELRLNGNFFDLTPLAALDQLRVLHAVSEGALANLWPLRGLPLEELTVKSKSEMEVSPLSSMKLKRLDLLPYRQDLTPLANTALRQFTAVGHVSNVKPLKGMPLESVVLGFCGQDLTPLQCPDLKRINLKFDFKHHTEALRALKLTTINSKPAEKFWMDLAEQHVEFVRREMKRLNPGFTSNLESSFQKNGDIHLTILDDQLADLSPLRHLPALKALYIGPKSEGASLKLSSLKPLTGLPLTHLDIHRSPELKDIGALRGLPLYHFALVFTGVEDLTPLEGMKLQSFAIRGSRVRDLSPLKGMRLNHFGVTLCPAEDFSVAAQMPISQVHIDFNYSRDREWMKRLRLEKINTRPAEEFWKEADAKQAKFDKWCADIAKLPASEQAQAVADELKRRNPGYDGNFSADLSSDGRSVGVFRLETGQTEDISPLRALPELKALVANSAKPNGGRLTNLWPLRGMKVTHYSLNNNPIRDLRPLAEAKGVTILNLDYSQFEDLSPLAEASSLKQLSIRSTPVKDLAPLAKLKLTSLGVPNTAVADLNPLKDMPLASLNVSGTKAADLGPLRSAPLVELNCVNSGIKDLAALQAWKLKSLTCDFVPWRDSAAIRALKTLETLNGKPAKEAHAWADWEDAVRAVPPMQQIEMLKAKLIELNGKDADVKRVYAREFDKDTKGITQLICNGDFKDVSPVRAFRDVRDLSLGTASYVGPRAALADLAPLEGMKLKRLSVQGSEAADLAPLRGMELEWLQLGWTKVTDLGPLRGMPLKTLYCNQGPSITSLEPLSESKLETLYCNSNPKLTSLKGLELLPLKWLDCGSCPIVSLESVKDCPLEHLSIGNGTQVTNLAPVAGIKTLKAVHCVNNYGPADLSQLKGLALETIQAPSNVRDLFFLMDMPIKKFSGPFNPWRDRDAMQSLKGLESVTLLGPPHQTLTAAEFRKQVEKQRTGFDAWVKTVSAMKPEEQIKAVSAELLRRNPGLKETEIGKEWKLSKDQSAVIAFQINSAEVISLEPLRALPDLESLTVYPASAKGKLTDLWPLQGMKLKHLSLANTMVEDLRPLAGMSLEALNAASTPVADLSPLRATKIQRLYLGGTSVTDFSPLLAVPELRDLSCPFVPERDAPILRQIKKLKTLNGKAKEEALK